MSVKISDITAGMKVKGTVHACKNCGILFIGRRDAKFCRDACRIATHRITIPDFTPLDMPTFIDFPALSPKKLRKAQKAREKSHVGLKQIVWSNDS